MRLKAQAVTLLSECCAATHQKSNTGAGAVAKEGILTDPRHGVPFKVLFLFLASHQNHSVCSYFRSCCCQLTFASVPQLDAVEVYKVTFKQSTEPSTDAFKHFVLSNHCSKRQSQSLGMLKKPSLIQIGVFVVAILC